MSDGRMVAFATDHAGGRDHDVIGEVRAAQQGEQNHLLRALPPRVYGAMLPHLKSVRLHFRQELIERNEPIVDVYFPRLGVSSVVTTAGTDAEIEVATVGNEGLLGVPIVLCDDRTPNRVFVQIEGTAARLPAEQFAALLETLPELRHLCLRYVHFFANELAQTAACNRRHPLEQRAARWLLMTHDRVGGARFDLTQEFLALMIGVRRAGVSVAMGQLQTAGVIRYTRGRITILDRAALEDASCPCYAMTRAARARLVGVG